MRKFRIEERQLRMAVRCDALCRWPIPLVAVLSLDERGSGHWGGSMAVWLQCSVSATCADSVSHAASCFVRHHLFRPFLRFPVQVQLADM